MKKEEEEEMRTLGGKLLLRRINGKVSLQTRTKGSNFYNFSRTNRVLKPLTDVLPNGVELKSGADMLRKRGKERWRGG